MVLAIVVALIAGVIYAMHLIVKVACRLCGLDAESAATTATWLLSTAAIIGVIALIALVINAFEGSGQALGYVAFVLGGAAVVAFLEWLANR